MAGKIFINYRRDDERAVAARVRDRLASVFGDANVFMDVDNLMAGQRFDQELEKALAETNVLLAVIGPRWMGLLAERQAESGHDYVHHEIAAALKRGIVVIPILIERAQLPSAGALPEDIRELVLHQKHTVTHEHFGRDLAGLVEAIRFAIKPTRDQAIANFPWSWIVSITAIVVAAYIYTFGVPAIWPTVVVPRSAGAPTNPYEQMIEPELTGATQRPARLSAKETDDIFAHAARDKGRSDSNSGSLKSERPRESKSPIAKAHEIAYNNMSHELVECAAYHSIAAEGVKTRAGNEALSASLSDAAKQGLTLAMQIANQNKQKLEVITARFKIEQEEQMKAIDGSYSNIAILSQRFVNTCKVLNENPVARFEKLIAAAEAEVNNEGKAKSSAREEAISSCVAKRLGFPPLPQGYRLDKTPENESIMATHENWCEKALAK